MGEQKKKHLLKRRFELREVEERDEAYQTALSRAPVDGAVWLSLPQWPYSCRGQLARGMQLEQILPCTRLMAISSFEH